MDNALNHTQPQQSWMEKVAHHIPGFSGYQDREERRNADKMQRDFLANALVTAKGKLLDANKALMAAHQLKSVSQVDHLCNVIDRVEERIRHESYGYAGFFDSIKINAPELDRVYQYDLTLLQQMSAIGEGVGSILNRATSGEDVTPLVEGLDSTLQNLDGAIDARQKVMLGVT